MRSSLPRLLCSALACAAALSAWAGREVLPYRATVEVTAAAKVGEAALREDVAAAVSASLRERGCLASVEPTRSTGADLLVRIHFEELTSETTYLSSLAQTVSPNAPPEAREGRTARLRAVLTVELADLPEERRLSQRRLTVDVRRAARMLDEDVEAAAREEALDQLGERVGAAVCKAAAKAPRR